MDDLEISVSALRDRLTRPESFLLIDVREPWEYEICRIGNAQLMPMSTVSGHLQTFDDGREVICYCHHGMRSLDVAVWLRGQGIEGAKSLAGGIDRWSVEIDPQIPRY